MTTKDLIRELKNRGFNIEKTSTKGSYRVNDEFNVRFKSSTSISPAYIKVYTLINNEVHLINYTLEGFLKLEESDR